MNSASLRILQKTLGIVLLALIIAMFLFPI